VRFIAVLGNTVGVDYNYLDLLVSRFLFPIRFLVTKSDLRCFVALAGILPAGKDTSLLVGLTAAGQQAARRRRRAGRMTRQSTDGGGGRAGTTGQWWGYVGGASVATTAWP